MIAGNMPENEREARIAWSLIVEPGDEYAGRFIAEHDSAHAALMTLMGQINLDEFIRLDTSYDQAFARWKPRLEGLPGRLGIVINQMAQFGYGFIQPGDDHWPAQRLARLGFGSPLGLYTRGSASLLRSEGVGVVGARAATGYGEHVTMELVAGLIKAGATTIISGGAYGIDGMAHRSALAAEGNTIAVMAGGIDRFYPSGHHALLTRVAEKGLVVSEVPPGTPPTKYRFLQRNRIIAALSEAVLVVEAGHRSGSINTAHHAHRIHVPIAAVPGPVTSAASAGCHRLISVGMAKLVVDVEGIRALLSGGFDCTCEQWNGITSAEPGHQHRGDENGCTVEGCYCESTKQ